MISLAPPMWRPKAEVAKKPKWLIVEADYMALTCRIDPNVIFWARGVARSDSVIPEDITDLWISDFVDRPVRSNLIDQALKRNLNIWWNRDDHRAIPILSLREKLLDVWGDLANRSMVYPAVDQGPDEMLRLGEERQALKERAKLERRELLREAAERAATKQAQVEARREGRLKEVLAEAYDLDREVYESYIRRHGQNGNRISVLAEEFGFPPANIERIIARIEARLAQG